MTPPNHFPPAPSGMKGRDGELATLVHTVLATAPARVALVGSGGSGKSMLAAALGHRLSKRFAARTYWFRVGAWDFRTLAEMLALRFRTTRERAALVPALRAFLNAGESLVVLDNHEDDRATARLLDELEGTPTTFVITARRCLLAGVIVFPVTAPLVISGRSAFPRVARLTRRLRWNPLALDIADAIVRSRAATVTELAAFLDAGGVGRVHVIEHEDDLPEVGLLVRWAWSRLSKDSRRILGVLAQIAGDHVDLESLAKLARVRMQGENAAHAMAPLARWHLVQEPMRGRYALHAVVRDAVARRMLRAVSNGRSPRGGSVQDRALEHYVSLLEKEPERLIWEQTHLFAAMDHASRTGDLSASLRIDELLRHI